MLECCCHGWAGVSADGGSGPHTRQVHDTVHGREEAGGQRRDLCLNLACSAIEYELSFTIGTAIKSVPANSSPGKWRLTWSWRVFSDFVTELKFTCPTHSEAKQTETSVLGAEGGLLQGQARGVACVLPHSGAPCWFCPGRSFYRQNWGAGVAGCRVRLCSDWLVG